ncbi:TIGR00341 family protein [Leptolyngbya boryana CZ1]|uniref:TIGR00341 family protein n=1 Tax=Leptolyngbya boryana CZ1 TaxID=3060204 RepID=A0AA97AUE5_LEPBY|nr:TIGR00341 family protein [Leptolyngbya boryana]WNZ44201.1 TIGR00341 family protein [Leptolyngbya boryana CZ1]
MRQLIIQVPQGQGKAVLQIAESCDAVNLAKIEAQSADRNIDLVIVHVSNRQVEDLLAKLEDLPEVHITLLPSGIIALRPPASEAAQQVKNVRARSPIEIFLSGLQSVGSWRSFLAYAAVAGVVVWIGLYTNTSYLLVAAMLIAPFAGPAMNSAIATARGDLQLLKRSILRYVTALMVTIAISFLLSLLLQQQISTPLMVENSQISTVAVLIPLAAGAAGALNLVQSERSSLVSGAAAGMLVAASLAPPAGIVGMASAIGRWDMTMSGLFLLVLQLFGIHVSATLIFRAYGLTSQGSRYSRGNQQVFPIALGISLVSLAAIATLQFWNSPEFERSSRAQRANAEVQQAVEQTEFAQLVEANVRFTRSEIPGQNSLLAEVYVQRQPESTLSSQQIRDRLTQTIQTRLLTQRFNVTPLVSVTVLEAPKTQ